MAITTTLSPFVGDKALYGVQAQAVFVERAEYSWTWLADSIVTQINAISGEINTTETNINAKESSAVSAATTATNAMNTTIAASGATQWVSGTSYVLGSVVWSPINGMSYRAKGATSGTTDPSLDSANWFILSFQPEIDEKLSHLSSTANTVNADGTIATYTYVGGYKQLFTYTSGDLTKVEYTDTDGTTVLLTETITYSNGLPLVTRS